MNREQKIKEFLLTAPNRWCSGGLCGCMGCVNGSSRHAWKQKYPEEEKITKEEFELLRPEK